MLSLADYHQYYQLFLSQGLGVGLGIGFMFLPALAIQGHYWKKRRALAMGIVMTGMSYYIFRILPGMLMSHEGTSCGGIVYPIMMNQLLHHSSLSFGWSVRAMAFMDVGLLLIAKVLMTTNHPPKRADSPKPNMRSVFTDVPFMIALCGFVTCCSSCLHG
jgi:hypothetical protein